MAERAHPQDPGFQGTAYEQKMHERYQFAARFAAGKDVLDAACGVCWGWIHLREARSITGFDISLDALQEARRLKFGDRCAAAEMRALPFRNAAFDVVACLEAIEHVAPSEAAAFLGECRRVLRPGGLLVLSTPLRQDGRHSGNPWHLAEYEEAEIARLLEVHFEPLETQVDADGQVPVFLYAGRLRPAPGPAVQHWREGGACRRTSRWLAEMATPAGFRFSRGGEATLSSTAVGVLLAEGLGAMSDLPVDWKRFAESIRTAQDEATGLFIDPLFAQVPLEGDLHGEEYFHWMNTYFALHALDALGERPRHRLSFLDPFLEGGAARNWLEGLDWSNPWRESNRVMHLLSALLFSLKWEANARAAQVYHDVLDWLDARQDPRTGLWGTDRGATLLNAVAGAYHFVPFYRYARRPVRAWSKIADACLELQQEDGLFGPAAGGGACEDADAIDLLCTAARAQKRVSPEIRKALTRAFWAIWNMQRDDGSFPYANVPGDAVYQFSSWPAMKARLNGGDVWATWFRLVALHTIRALLGDDLPPLGPWTFRRFPALGFHLMDTAVPDGAEPSHRPIWFRPLAAPPAPEQPRVAAIVTCFNLGEYIYEALASLCRQTLTEVETVIIDDGSTDPFTVARLDALAAEGWRVIRTENRGLPAARNLGIRQTRAPYLCSVDADDILRPAYFEKAAGALDANPRAGFVSCFYALFDEAEGAYRYTRPRLPEMLARNEAVGVSVFRRQAWLEAGGYCETLPAMQDWDLWISILEKGWQGLVLPEVLFDYRIRAGSMYSETKKPANYARNTAMIVSRHRELFAKYIEEVLLLRARYFAEEIGHSARMRAALGAELRSLRQRLAAASQQAAGTPAPAPADPEETGAEGTPQASPAPAPAKPSLLNSALWAIAQSVHPRDRWRGLRNFAALVRVMRSARTRTVWDQLFDAAHYCRSRPDVAAARIFPALHYALAGAWEGADPSAKFSTGYYWKRHPDVARAGLNPLLHYALFGAAEGRCVFPAGGSPATVRFSAAVRSQGGPRVAPLVSVVVPCFNYGRYAEEAVRSVLNQTFRNTEIILVEGGSTDAETRARLRKLERAGFDRLRIVYRNRPHLAGDNRNFGISLARGRYVCCLDADDLLDPAYLEVAVFFLEFCGLDFVSPSVQSFGHSREQWIVANPSWPDILKANQVATVAVFRKEIWEAIGGYRDWGKEEQYVPEDWDFWIRAVAAGFRGLSLELPMMMYRVRPDSLSRRGTASMEAWAARLAEEHAGLAGRPAPAAPPCSRAPRAAWESFEEEPPAAGAVMMALPFFTEGGAERIFRALAQRWRERGAKLVIITTLELNPEIPDRLEVLRRETPYVYPLAQLFRGREDQAADFVYFLLRRHRIQLLYFAGADLIYRLLPHIRSTFPGLRIVDQLFNDEVHFYSNRELSRYIDCTVVPGRRIARRLTDEFGERPSRVALIPHGVPLPDLAGGRIGDCPPGFPPEFSGRPVVGFFGRFSEEKGPADFVRIAAKIRKRFPEACFVMTGEGPEMKAVQKEIRRRGLSSCFCLPGFVGDVQPWLASADVVVVPSRLDGMPLVIFEAQGLGKPVVASRTGSIPEVIEDGATGFLRSPGDIDGFAEAVCRLLESAELRSGIGAAAREKVAREYGQEAMLERYFRLFDRLAPPRAGGSR